MNDEIDSEYLTYNGFNRPALVAGVPLMLMLPILGFSIFGGFIFVNIFGLFGIIPVGLSLLSIIVIRAMTDNDPNALRVVRFNLKGFFIKLGVPILGVRGRE